MEASITFETVTEESLEDGATEDHGWIAPNQYRVSLGLAGNDKAYRKRVRMSQRGRYDWQLGNAVRFMLGKLSNGQSEVDVDVRTGFPDKLPFIWSLRVEVERSQEDEQCAEAVGYSLHVSGLTQGTADRLERLFHEKGARLPYARSSSLRRAG